MADDFDAIVIGGGPAGSTLGAILAEAGLQVVILERERFPRFHIGESLLPASVRVLDRLGVHERIKEEFVLKPGGKWYYGDDPVEGLFSFTDRKASFKDYPYCYMAERSRFDEILLDNASAKGADVRQETSVNDLIWDGERLAGVVAQAQSGEPYELRADIVFDCSGRGGVIANRLNLRTPTTRKRMAAFAHYRATPHDEDLAAGWFVGKQIHDGWVWAIPLADDLMSVGVVCNVDEYKRVASDPAQFLDHLVATNDLLDRALSPDRQRVTPVKVTSNVGYTCSRMVGDGWVLVGDAAFFVDPCYSSGVHLAMASAEMAADTLIEARRAGGTRESAPFAAYETHFRKHERIVTQMVDAFYLATRNRWVRKATAIGARMKLPTRIFTTFVGGDFSQNNWLITAMYHLSRFVATVLPDRSRSLAPPVCPAPSTVNVPQPTVNANKAA